MAEAERIFTGRSLRWMVVTALLAALVAVGGLALLVKIVERKQEAQNPFFRVVALDDTTTDPALWGKNFPVQYDLYRRTVDHVRTRFGGSEAVPRTPTAAGPRSIVSRSPAGHLPSLPPLRLCDLQDSGCGRLDSGLRKSQRHVVSGSPQTGRTCGGLHRLPRPADDGAAHHPTRVSRRNPHAQSRGGHHRLRPQPHGQSAGDARLCVGAEPGAEPTLLRLLPRAAPARIPSARPSHGSLRDPCRRGRTPPECGGGERHRKGSPAPVPGSSCVSARYDANPVDDHRLEDGVLIEVWRPWAGGRGYKAIYQNRGSRKPWGGVPSPRG